MADLRKLRNDGPIRAYHSTWLAIEPHELNDDSSIHAGTMQSAYDRLSHGLDVTLDDSDYGNGEVMDSYLHAYEIPRGLISRTMSLDPDSPNVLRHSNTSRKRLRKAPQKISSWDADESKQPTSVVQYRNTHEDPGSISYVIPSNLIHSGKVKYLGAQFIASHELDDENPGGFEAPNTGFNEYGDKLKDF